MSYTEGQFDKMCNKTEASSAKSIWGMTTFITFYNTFSYSEIIANVYCK